MRDLMKFFSEKVHSKKMINDRGTYRVGFTAVINSINKVPMDYMGNGGVLDLK